MKRNIRIMYLMAALQGMVFYGPIATLRQTLQSKTLILFLVGVAFFFIWFLKNGRLNTAAAAADMRPPTGRS